MEIKISTSKTICKNCKKRELENLTIHFDKGFNNLNLCSDCMEVLGNEIANENWRKFNLGGSI